MKIDTKTFFNFAFTKRFILIVYVVMAMFTAIKQYYHPSYNNYKIYKYTYYHTLEQKSLYDLYPEKYNDSNHYGPVFALVIMPFALLPDIFGMVLWNLSNVLLFYFGIFSLTLSVKNKAIIGLLCGHELFGALLSFQFNVGLTGLILLSFSYMIKEKEIKSSFMILLGTLIKLYGIVGLAFFFFTKNKWKLIVSCFCFGIVLLLLPALFSSLNFVQHSYFDWYESLSKKNSTNISQSYFQDISFMGIVRRVSGNYQIPSAPFIIGGLLLFLATYLRKNQFQENAFRLMMLASVLIFTVIFSTGSESPTYIIAFAGVSIWFVVQPYPKKNWQIALLIFAFILTTLSPSDLFPQSININYVRRYSLKALPCVIIWFVIIYQMLTVDFRKYNVVEE